jgi:hypothetical protein
MPHERLPLGRRRRLLVAGDDGRQNGAPPVAKLRHVAEQIASGRPRTRTASAVNSDGDRPTVPIMRNQPLRSDARCGWHITAADVPAQ